MAGTNNTAGASTSPSNYDKLSGETSNDPDVSFEGLGDDFDTNVEFSETKSTSVKPTVPVPVQTQQTATQPVKAAPTQAAPQAEPPQPPAQVPAVDPPKPTAQMTEVDPSQPLSLDALIGQFEANSQAMADQLAPSFAIDDALAAELDTDWRGAMPKVLAKTFVNAVQTSLQYMQMYVPQIVSQAQAQENAYREAETSFFSKFKTLDRSKHGNDIRAYARAFAQANPGLTRDQLFDFVGNAVMAKFGLVGQQPPVPGNQPPARQMPFSPAASSAPAMNVTVTDVNPFSGLGMDFDN